MKKHSLYSILILSILLFASCSVEELLKEEPGNVELLTSNSPWTFKSFELAWATKPETDTITDQEIENGVNDNYKDFELTFHSDGTGQTIIRNTEEEALTWSWFFDGNDKLCFDGVCGTDSFTNIKLSENNFSFDLTAGAPSNTEGEKIIYSGRYTFN